MGSSPETDLGISSLMDTWINLKSIETDGKEIEPLTLVKTRGMFHSNQVREFNITNNGLELIDIYLGPAGMLTGSARISQIAKEKAEKVHAEKRNSTKSKEKLSVNEKYWKEKSQSSQHNLNQKNKNY